MNPLPEKPITTDEVAAYFGVSRLTVVRWIEKGTLKAYKVGRRWFIAPSELQRLMKENSNKK